MSIATNAITTKRITRLRCGSSNTTARYQPPDGSVRQARNSSAERCRHVRQQAESAPGHARPAHSGTYDTSDRWRNAATACLLRPKWAHLGSNQGPPACEAGALPLSYAPESRAEDTQPPFAATAGFAGGGRNGDGSKEEPRKVIMARAASRTYRGRAGLVEG